MIGGDKDQYERAVPLLDCMGRAAIYCGAHGSGQAAKICNNMLLGASMIATSEALQLGIK
jgi:3-hydroxyisobutyrate dehydrogenase